MTPLVLAEPERPFWGFAELLLAVAILLAALGVVVGFAGYLHAPQDSGLWSVLEEVVAYAILFLALKIMFARYDRGLLESLGWSKPGPFGTLSLAVIGVSLSVTGTLLQYALQTPLDVERPFDKLLDDPTSRMAIGLFSITLGPAVEELLFRGFLQPLFIGMMGVFPGILLTSVLFGALHMNQYGNIWQIGLLLTLVGFVLGTVRHLSGSTRASTIVHIGFNAVSFLALLAAGSPLTKK